MSDGIDDLLGDNDTSGSGQNGKGLRAQLEAALAREKALTERFEQMARAERSRSIEALFSKHSVPALAKDLFPADAEVTDESVTALVEKYGSLWGATASAATTPPAEQAATQAAQQLAAQAAPPPVGPMSEEDYRAKFAEAQTRDEFLRMLADLNAAGTS